MAKIENYKYSIGEAFRDCFYIVPDYQREYVWTDKEAQESSSFAFSPGLMFISLLSEVNPLETS